MGISIRSAKVQTVLEATRQACLQAVVIPVADRICVFK
jgi:hypothetical protein